MKNIFIFVMFCVYPSLACSDDSVKSGYQFMELETRLLQDDDFLNPGFFLVEVGEKYWNSKLNNDGQACAECHGNVTTSMKGVSIEYPRYDTQSKNLINLQGKIISEFTKYNNVSGLYYDSEPILALTALISLQSRGMEINTVLSEELEPFWVSGKKLYETRRGQLNLSCSNCHVDLVGQRLRGDLISQGHINAFPIYRLLWGEPGSTHRMFEWCMNAVRSEPYSRGSTEYVELELYLMHRGNGMISESPGVRR
jgi:sulfur-oxidizing protein SoxA